MKFYVYTLTYDGWVFYVGKGSGQRMDSHRYLAEKGANLKLYDFIRELWAEGGDYEAVKVFETDDEEEALTYEQGLIEEYGVDRLINASPDRTGPRKRDNAAPQPIAPPAETHIQAVVMTVPLRKPANLYPTLTEEAWKDLEEWANTVGKQTPDDLREHVLVSCGDDAQAAARALLAHIQAEQAALALLLATGGQP